MKGDSRFFLCVLIGFHTAVRPASRGLWRPPYRGIEMNVFSVSHGCGQCCFHLVWKPKYAYSILTGRVKIECERVLRDIAGRHSLTLHALEVMPDHVHVSASFPPSLSASRVLQLLKGASSRELFRRFPRLRKTYWGGHLWSPGKFYRSVGAVNARL